MERLTSKDLSQRFPAWHHEKFIDNYLNPHSGWVESGKATALLAKEAIEIGVKTKICAVSSLLIDDLNQTVTGVRLEDDTTLTADYVVIAAGAW